MCGEREREREREVEGRHLGHVVAEIPLTVGVGTDPQAAVVAVLAHLAGILNSVLMSLEAPAAVRPIARVLRDARLKVRDRLAPKVLRTRATERPTTTGARRESRRRRLPPSLPLSVRSIRVRHRQTNADSSRRAAHRVAFASRRVGSIGSGRFRGSGEMMVPAFDLI